MLIANSKEDGEITSYGKYVGWADEQLFRDLTVLSSTALIVHSPFPNCFLSKQVGCTMSRFVIKVDCLVFQSSKFCCVGIPHTAMFVKAKTGIFHFFLTSGSMFSITWVVFSLVENGWKSWRGFLAGFMSASHLFCSCCNWGKTPPFPSIVYILCQMVGVAAEEKSQKEPRNTLPFPT